MYILPNTKIRLIKNCPLDKNYENTIYFTSLAQQTTYFMSTLQGLLFDQNSYQRVNKGSLRVAVNAEAIYNYNYLAFQNTSFGDRWFYAFITKVEYINNITSEITYEIDLLQTWHFSYELEQCFVEREHSVTDEIGDNLVEESLATGEYVTDGIEEFSALNSYELVLWCTINKEKQLISGKKFYQGHQYYFSGLYDVRFPLTSDGIDQAVIWYNGLSGLEQKALVCATVIPTYASSSSPNLLSISKKTTLLRSDGTNVKNNKCLIYPYNFLYVTNYQGKTANYRYEFFPNQGIGTERIIYFRPFCDISPHPTTILIPQDYKGSSGDNLDEKIDLAGFPQVSMNADSFKAWLAQTASSLAINTLSVATGALIEDPEMITKGVTGLVQNAVSGFIASATPPQNKGFNNSSTMLAYGKLNFGFMKKHITPEFATIIDDYFSMFGYATKKVKVPNRNARPEWSYVKTIGCKINGIASGFGGVPADDAEKIENIYNNGVRFWTNPAHIGNYSYNNSPTIQGGET